MCFVGVTDLRIEENAELSNRDEGYNRDCDVINDKKNTSIPHYR